jgi:hypothetical protein
LALKNHSTLRDEAVANGLGVTAELFNKIVSPNQLIFAKAKHYFITATENWE